MAAILVDDGYFEFLGKDWLAPMPPSLAQSLEFPSVNVTKAGLLFLLADEADEKNDEYHAGKKRPIVGLTCIYRLLDDPSRQDDGGQQRTGAMGHLVDKKPKQQAILRGARKLCLWWCCVGAGDQSTKMCLTSCVSQPANSSL